MKIPALHSRENPCVSLLPPACALRREEGVRKDLLSRALNRASQDEHPTGLGHRRHQRAELEQAERGEEDAVLRECPKQPPKDGLEAAARQEVRAAVPADVGQGRELVGDGRLGRG